MVVLAERNLGRELYARLLVGSKRIPALLLFNYLGLSLKNLFLGLNNCYHDPLITLSTVPYLGRPEYDRSGFHNYPSGRGFTNELFSNQRFNEYFSQARPQVFASFLQNWLFFGTLSEVLGRYVMIGEFRNVVYGCITLTGLPKYIEE